MLHAILHFFIPIAFIPIIPIAIPITIIPIAVAFLLLSFFNNFISSRTKQIINLAYLLLNAILPLARFSSWFIDWYLVDLGKFDGLVSWGFLLVLGGDWLLMLGVGNEWILGWLVGDVWELEGHKKVDLNILTLVALLKPIVMGNIWVVVCHLVTQLQSFIKLLSLKI